MQNTTGRHQPTGRQRRIGPIGTTARVIVGTLLVGSVIQGHLAGPFRPAAWALGTVVLSSGRAGRVSRREWRVERPGRGCVVGVDVGEGSGASVTRAAASDFSTSA